MLYLAVLACPGLSFAVIYVLFNYGSLFNQKSWQIDEEVDELISRIKLEEGNTEFWKRRFLGEQIIYDNAKPMDGQDLESEEIMDDADIVEDDASKDGEDDEADEEEAEVEVEAEQTESQEDLVDRVKVKEVDAKKPLQMIGVQLLKDTDQPTTSKKSRRRSFMVAEVWVLYHMLTSFQL